MDQWIARDGNEPLWLYDDEPQWLPEAKGPVMVTISATDRFQTVTLKLSDGSEATFIGRAQIDTDNPPRVVDVVVSTPQLLPAGMTWDVMKGESNGH